MSSIIADTLKAGPRTKRAYEDQKQKNHIEKLIAFVRFFNILGYIIGMEVEETYQWSNRTMSTFLILLVTVWSWFYSLSLIYNTLTCVTLIAGSALIASSSIKLFTNTMRNREIHSIVSFAIFVFKRNPTGDRATILTKTVNDIYFHGKVLTFSIFFGLGVYSLYPVQDFLLNGNYTLVAPLFFPYVDENTLSGYMIITAFTVVASTVALSGSLIFSLLFVTLTDVYNGFVLLVQDDFKTLDAMWAKQKESEINIRRAYFRNITLELMDVVNFLQYMRAVLGNIMTVQIVSCYIGIVCSLFGYLAGSFAGGVGSVVYFTTELFMCCTIGTMLEAAIMKNIYSLLMVMLNTML